MKKCVTVVTLFMTLVLWAFSLNAQDRFDRAAVIPAEADDIGGFGGVVAGVDFDGDGRPEIYAVNNDWHDEIGKDLKPRMYKYEQNASGAWEIVWSTELSFNFQNTWPGFEAADLDKDGRQEIVWGPVNNFGGGSNPNPSRIVVFESAGDGSDIMGVDDGAGGYKPNAEWTIVDQDNVNLRPFRWHIVDIDNDNTDEIVACIRAGDVGMQIYSTNDVPDAGDGSETWELEFSGLSGVYWDINVIGNTAYAIEQGGDVTSVSWDGSAYVVGKTQAGLVPGGSWKSSSVVDIDGNGEVIVVGGWASSSDNQVWILQPDADSLIATQIADFPNSAGRIYGGAAGDLDSDGQVDFVFGSRDSDPNARIHRLEYQGGDILDPNSYALSIIDQGVSPAVQYDVIATANMDGDSDDEVVYSGTPRGNSASDPPQPIVVLDRVPGNQPIISAVQDVPNDQGRQVWVIWEGAADDVPGMRFTANLSGANQPTPVATTGTGKATFTLSEDKTTLSYLLEVHNITGVTQAHIHQGQPGVGGPFGVFLFGLLQGGTGPFNGILSSGTITEADLINQWAGDFEGFLNDLMAGNTYVNVHTVANPGGEIRGQLLSDPVSKADRQPAKASGFDITHYVVWRIDDGQYPVQVASVDAIQAAAYAAVVPTLGDGPEYEATYVVSAHTPTTTTLWKSFPKSGTSVDNLVPTAPTNLAAGLLDGNVQLTWDESPDPDFNYFSIRRGDQAGFDPNTAEEVGTTTEAVFVDENVQAGETWYYRVVAFDFNNNLGEFSEEVFASITGIADDAGALPRAFALRQNFPNPFNPETNITFDLPKAVDVNIVIYNSLGQKVRTLVDESRPAGTHTVRWNGRNDAGVKVASGLYIYIIKAGEFSATKKMTLLK